MKIRPVGAELFHAARRTDRHDEAVVASCNFAKGSKMDLQELGWDGMDWIDLAQDRERWRAL
jgi:hypothetical protein